MYYQPNPNQIVVVPTPDVSADVIFRVAYVPTRTATTCIDWIHEYYLDAIVAGALYRLLSMPAQPWSNPTMAAENGKMFSSYVTDAAIEANKSFNRGGVRVQFRTKS